VNFTVFLHLDYISQRTHGIRHCCREVLRLVRVMLLFLQLDFRALCMCD